MLNPRSVFRAPPVAPVQGLATRGPAAAARATGGRVPVITTDEGVTTPAPQGPTGLASLTGDMQREIENTESPDELNWKMAQAGEELGILFRGEDDLSGEGDVLSGSEGTEVLVGGEDSGGEKTTMDDGRKLELGGVFQDQPQVSVPFMDRTVAATPMGTDAQMAQYEADLLKAAQAPA